MHPPRISKQNVAIVYFLNSKLLNNLVGKDNPLPNKSVNPFTKKVLRLSIRNVIKEIYIVKE